MKKILPIILVTVIVIGGGSFYAGIKYQENKTPAPANFQDLRNLSPEERQQRMQQFGNGARRAPNGQSGASFINGDIISKDEQSITVKLRDGGSKIIFYSATTEIGKFTSGEQNDLEVGKMVSVNGSANSDGSITAQSIQIRPQTQ